MPRVGQLVRGGVGIDWVPVLPVAWTVSEAQVADGTSLRSFCAVAGGSGDKQ